MLNKWFRIRFFTTSSLVSAMAIVVAFGCGAAYGKGAGDPLPISADQSQALLKKTAAMEAQIQQRKLQRQQQSHQPGSQQPESQQQPPPKQQVGVGQPGDLKEYQAGFSDGYNKAILDLVRSKLLNDPSLLPKLMDSGLRRSTCINSDQAMANGAVQAIRGQAVRRQSVPQTPAVDSSVVRATEVITPTEAKNRASDAGESVSNATSAVAPVAVTTTPAVTNGPGQTGVTANRETANSALAASSAQQPMETAAKTVSRDTAQTWIKKGNTYLKAKDWQKAINAATAAMAIDAALVESYILRSWAYAEIGQPQKAIDDINGALRLDPNNALAYNNLGYVNELINNRDKAQENYQKACGLNYQPACKTAQKLRQAMARKQKAKIDQLTELSYRQFQQKDWKGVVKTATELLKLDPQDTVALVNRAGAYTGLGLYNKAMDDCNKALIIDPDMGLAYNNKGYVLELLGKPGKASLEYQTACVLGVKQSCGDFKRLSQKVSSR